MPLPRAMPISQHQLAAAVLAADHIVDRRAIAAFVADLATQPAPNPFPNTSAGAVRQVWQQRVIEFRSFGVQVAGLACLLKSLSGMSVDEPLVQEILRAGPHTTNVFRHRDDSRIVGAVLYGKPGLALPALPVPGSLHRPPSRRTHLRARSSTVRDDGSFGSVRGARLHVVPSWRDSVRMSQDSTLANALADVRRQRAALETDFERVGAELTKLRLAERSLASIVEGTPLEDLPDEQPRRRASAGDDQARGGRGAGRGSRGPRANSAKGRLKALLEEAGPQGLSHAQISDRLQDVAPNTLATYLSMLTTSGEVERHGDVYRGVASVAQPVADTSDGGDPDGVEHAPAEEE